MFEQGWWNNEAPGLYRMSRAERRGVELSSPDAGAIGGSGGTLREEDPRGATSLKEADIYTTAICTSLKPLRLETNVE